jgi:hypothetical protein
MWKLREGAKNKTDCHWQLPLEKLRRQAGDPASIEEGIEVGICYEGDLFSYYFYVQLLGDVQFSGHIINKPLSQALR